MLGEPKKSIKSSTYAVAFQVNLKLKFLVNEALEKQFESACLGARPTGPHFLLVLVSKNLPGAQIST
jgi:hypothetical protein